VTAASAVDHTGDLDWGLKNWAPAQHPRDRHGRFTGSRTTDLTDAERDQARAVIANFKPKKFSNGAQADTYLRDNAGPLTRDQISAVDTYSGDAFLEINRDLRSGGDGGEGHQTTIKDLRAGMTPTPDDLILTRTVPADAFPKGALDSLAGKKVKDAAFSSTALGVTYGFGLGNVQMKIAVPKGTPAIFVAPHSRNPHEREILLPDGMEFAVASVTKSDDYGGYNVSLIALPKNGGGGSVKDVAHRGHVRAEDAPPDPDLSELDAAYQKAVDAFMERWGHISAEQRVQLRRQIVDAVNDGDLAKLASLTVDTGQAAAALNEAMLALATIAAAQAVTEGATAGVVLTAATATALGFAKTADLVTTLLGSDLALAAGREAARLATPGVSGEQVATQVDTVLKERSTAATEAQVGGALHASTTEARVQTFLSGPVGSLYHDGQLDTRQCVNCKAATGRFVCTTENLRPYELLFTKLGGYRDCLGGIRCRCTVTGVWRPKQAPESERPGIGVGES
jgi:hypothetical protein